MSENRQRTQLIVIRVLPAERAVLVAAAAARGVSVSQLIRTAALAAATHTSGGPPWT